MASRAGTDIGRGSRQCQHGLLKGILVYGQDFGWVGGRGQVRMRGLTATHCMVIGREAEESPFWQSRNPHIFQWDT